MISFIIKKIDNTLMDFNADHTKIVSYILKKIKMNEVILLNILINIKRPLLSIEKKWEKGKIRNSFKTVLYERKVLHFY